MLEHARERERNKVSDADGVESGPISWKGSEVGPVTDV